MANSNNVSELIAQNIIISNNTKDLFSKRINDDFRIHFANYVLFEDGLRNDILQSSPDEEVLRKALPGDIFAYSIIPDYRTIKLSLENNLANIAKLRSQKQYASNIKRVWVICYDISNEDAEKGTVLPSIVIYRDPDAVDINKIVKEQRTILGLFTILEYADPTQDKEAPVRIEWVFLSPGDPKKLNEYEEYLKKREAEMLERMFYLNFQ